MAEREVDRSVSQTVKAQLALRDQLLSGALRPGERISELQAVETTGASRTPVRMALVRLEEEGLLEAILRRLHGEGIFRARHFRFHRAARHAGGAGRPVRRRARRLRARARAIEGMPCRDRRAAAPGADLDRAFSSYVTLNARFHALLTELSRSPPLIRQIDRASALPFASPSGFVMAQSALPEAQQILIIGQEHHRVVIDAIENREGARAEAVMREHARLAVRNLRLALRNRTHLDLLPALALIKTATD